MPKTNKICIVHNSLRTALIFREKYILQLRKRDIPVYCVAPEDDPYAKSKLESYGVHVLSVKKRSPPFLFLTMNYQLLKLILKDRKNFIFACHFITTIALTSPSLFLSRKSVCFIEGIGTFFTNKPVRIILFKYLLRSLSQKVVFMNDEEKMLLGKKTDIVMNGIGVDLSKFTLAEPVQETELQNNVELLFVGRLLEDKGIHDCINVIRNLRLSNRNYVLNLIGDIYPSNPGSITNEDIQLLEKELGGYVHFHRFQQDVVHHYQKTSILLLLSKHEGFPVVVMEANACGVPVIAYDVPGCRQAVKPGVNGFLVDLDDTDKVIELCTTIDYRKMASSCREYALENFDHIVKTDQIVELLLE